MDLAEQFSLPGARIEVVLADSDFEIFVFFLFAPEIYRVTSSRTASYGDTMLRLGWHRLTSMLGDEMQI
jgi:hypothetical protein